MKNRISFLLLLSAVMLMSLNTSAQVKMGGITLPESITAGTTKLNYNGGGIRQKLMMNIYVAGLYLTEKGKTGPEITTANKPMAIRLHIVSGLITPKKMEDALVEGFKKATNNKTEPLQAKIDEFKSVFMEGIQEGDIFDFIFTPEEGVAVLKNGTKKKVIKGNDFKMALFSIWIGPDPVDNALKKGMLGLISM